MPFFCRHPTFKGFTGALLVHGCLDSVPLMSINIGPTSLKDFKLRPCSLHLYSFDHFQLCQTLHGLLFHHKNPSWPEEFLCFRVIVSPILVSYQARESATVARRILVISPESSHCWYEAVLVFARARMCGHLPLVRFAYAKKHAK